jgi:hypothetical protein
MYNPRHSTDEQDCEQEADQPPRLEQRMSKLEKIRFIVTTLNLISTVVRCLIDRTHWP